MRRRSEDRRESRRGNQFRFTDGQWQFNLNTKALGGNAQGTWLLKATLFDGSSYSVWISMKK